MTEWDTPLTLSLKKERRLKRGERKECGRDIDFKYNPPKPNDWGILKLFLSRVIPSLSSGWEVFMWIFAAMEDTIQMTIKINHWLSCSPILMSSGTRYCLLVNVTKSRWTRLEAVEDRCFQSQQEWPCWLWHSGCLRWDLFGESASYPNAASTWKFQKATYKNIRLKF